MTDKVTIRIVVVALAFGALGGMAAVSLLVWSKVPAAELAVVSSLAGQALGALTGLLISTRSTSDPPQEVTVTNPPHDPVNVEEAGLTEVGILIVSAVIAAALVVLINVWWFNLTL